MNGNCLARFEYRDGAAVCVAHADSECIALQFSFIAENVGDSLLFTVDSTTHLTSEGSNYTGLTISFLKTYEHFGQAGACTQLLKPFRNSLMWTCVQLSDFL